ncbi:MAG: putative chemotaxis signal transduction protein CheW [Myxococcales bacterium]|nr:putative chemotaxis signal transduction protein CheW [Myxococcales bacterium]
MKDRVDDLGAVFDRAFADAPAPPAVPHVDVLRVRLAGELYAIVLAEIAGLYADLHVVPMPSPAPELLGIVSVRNAIVPVYDLRAVLGVGIGLPSRWLVIGRSTPAVAFAFDDFEGHARCPSSAIAQSAGAPIRGVVPLDGRLYQVVDLGSVHTSLHTRWEQKG